MTNISLGEAMFWIYAFIGLFCLGVYLFARGRKVGISYEKGGPYPRDEEPIGPGELM